MADRIPAPVPPAAHPIDEAVRHSLIGHDRDCALAMLSQARHRRPLDDVQVAHLLAIGFTAGVAAGRSAAAADILQKINDWRPQANTSLYALDVLSLAAEIAEGKTDG